MKFQVKYELGVGKREVHNYEVTINKPKGLKVVKEDQIAHMPCGQ